MTATVPGKFVFLALSLGLFLTFGAIAYAKAMGRHPWPATTVNRPARKKQMRNDRRAGTPRATAMMSIPTMPLSSHKQ